MLFELLWCRKNNHSTQTCVDYRDLYAQTENNLFSLPRINEVWQTFFKVKYFRADDLLMGYHLVKKEPKDRFKKAIVTHKGLFVYIVMPFRLCNASATF